MGSLGGRLKQRRRGRECELCNAEAAVYCGADAAFLCWACDAGVHGANFIVARHLRWVACAGCGCLEAQRLLTGAGSSPVCSLCCSCQFPAGRGGGESESCLSSAASCSSDSCVSTAESAPVVAREKKTTVVAARRRRRRRTFY